MSAFRGLAVVLAGSFEGDKDGSLGSAVAEEIASAWSRSVAFSSTVGSADATLTIPMTPIA
jgi:hypothetical protein